MVLIYNNFSKAFAGINFETGSEEYCVPVPGGRGYLRAGWDGKETKPYLDTIHFDIHDESWYTQEALRDRLAADTAMHGRVYAGCAGQVNLDYMAATKAPAAMLYDINPLQAEMWNGFFELAGAEPDNRAFAKTLPSFARALYYRLEHMYGAEAIKPYMKPPVRDEKDRGWNSPSSPFRGMSYQRFEEWIDYRMSEQYARGTGSWIRDPEMYKHVHMLGKHRAVAAVTVDVRDHIACRRIGEQLARASYDVIDTADGTSHGPRTGAKIGFLYRSNVCHFMKWSRKEIDAYKEKNGREPGDYSGRPVNTDTYRQVLRNLRYWLDPKDSHMIAADVSSGGSWAQFRPKLKSMAFTPAP